MKTFFSYIYDFIPILFIIFIVFFPFNFVPFSYTILGKFIAILFLVYLTKVDIILGLIFCLFLIYYYQQEKYESLLNMSDDNLWRWTLETGKGIVGDDENYQKYKYDINKDLNLEYSKPEEKDPFYKDIEFPNQVKDDLLYKKILVENELVLPKNSNEMTDTILQRFSIVKS